MVSRWVKFADADEEPCRDLTEAVSKAEVAWMLWSW